MCMQHEKLRSSVTPPASSRTGERTVCPVSLYLPFSVLALQYFVLSNPTASDLMLLFRGTGMWMDYQSTRPLLIFVPQWGGKKVEVGGWERCYLTAVSGSKPVKTKCRPKETF